MKRGQAFLEYLLFMAILVGVILGVFFPVFKSKMEAIQKSVGDAASSTVSQRTLGIPLEWFFAGDGGGGGNLDNFLSGLGNAGQGLDGKGGAGSDPSGSGGGPGDSQILAGSGASGGGLAGGAGGRGGTSSDPSKSKDVDLFSAEKGATKKSDVEIGSPPEAKKETDPKKGDAGKGASSEEGSNVANLGKKQLLQKDEGRGLAKGCQDLDFWTVIKILLILAIIIIGAILALSNRGTQGKK